MSIGLYIVLAPLYLKSVRKLQEKRFVFVKILAIIIPENGAKVSKIKCFQFAQQTLFMITFGRKLKHLRQKNHLTQKELGIALGFPEDSADVRIAQYETDTRKPRDEILVKMAKTLNVPLDILTVPVLSEPKEYEAASFWMHELAAEL